MSIPELSPKLAVGEDIYVDVDFGDLIDDPNTLTGCTVTAVVFMGAADASPQSIVSGAATRSGKIASQKITAGVAGTVYLLEFAGTASDGQTPKSQLLLPVVSLRLD